MTGESMRSRTGPRPLLFSPESGRRPGLRHPLRRVALLGRRRLEHALLAPGSDQRRQLWRPRTGVALAGRQLRAVARLHPSLPIYRWEVVHRRRSESHGLGPGSGHRSALDVPGAAHHPLGAVFAKEPRQGCGVPRGRRTRRDLLGEPAFFLHALDATGLPLEGFAPYRSTASTRQARDLLEALGHPYDPDYGIPDSIGYITNTSPPIVVNGVVVIGNSNLTGRLDPRQENVPGARTTRARGNTSGSST